MNFESLKYLWLLLLVPPLAYLMARSWSLFGKFENSPKMGLFSYASERPSWAARWIVGFMRAAALSLIIVGLADPYVMRPTKEVRYKDVRIFYLMDVSGSMQYAEDVKPNRLVAVRGETARFMKSLDGNYETSIIPFAGSANPYYCPLTASPRVYVPLMERIGPDAAPTLGTDMTAAFDVLEEAIRRDKLDETGVNVIFLITDGGKEEADATNRIKLNELVTKLASKNCRINVIGVGGREPAPLIRRDRQGSYVGPVLEEGQPATSQLDEEILMQLAESGKGNYIRFESENQLYTFLDVSLKENRVVSEGDIVYKKVTLQCYLFATAALLFWCCFLANRSRSWRSLGWKRAN
jgi:Ca-activated chloride channel family protein